MTHDWDTAQKWVDEHKENIMKYINKNNIAEYVYHSGVDGCIPRRDTDDLVRVS
jgi:4-alpha-glucanotransferase